MFTNSTLVRKTNGEIVYTPQPLYPKVWNGGDVDEIMQFEKENEQLIKAIYDAPDVGRENIDY